MVALADASERLGGTDDDARGEADGSTTTGGARATNERDGDLLVLASIEILLLALGEAVAVTFEAGIELLKEGVWVAVSDVVSEGV